MRIMGSLDSTWEGEWGKFDPVPDVAGLRPYAEVHTSQAQAAIFLSIEPNPSCPNAVIEAMAAGLPVIGFDTGSLRDLVGRGGEVVAYDGDPWRQGIPRNLEEIGEAGRQVLANWAAYSQAARMEAEARFDIHETARAYRDVLAG
jgi:glycosyltransferase involved in cell wall biosynthesis